MKHWMAECVALMDIMELSGACWLDLAHTLQLALLLLR